MSMDGKFVVIRVNANDRKIMKEFTGRKGFAAANELCDKLNETADKLTYHYVKGELYV
jgi:hypothetical protein